ncbi:heme A synthase [Planktotalea sp.]|uniref:heme A synthase n=1 Tax=Planktotalea sp. TaxID=2029877 RepID=UPI0025D533F7|nr:heme A synthase [Planktotalea sp.]
MIKKRSIFEEVETVEKVAPVTGVIDAGKRGARKGIRLWLIILFALVALMIHVGGLTRLTDSGLSITEWKPVTGAMPPISEAAWQSEFDKYREIPEYKLQNQGMSLAEFQFIYWWEWGHRQLGRVVGLVWAIGFFGFLLTRNVPTGWTGRLLGIGVLGGIQGAVGWWMVSSGLTGKMLDVASYRLATHLGLAFIILGFIAWFVFDLKCEERQLIQCRRHREMRLYTLTTWLTALAFVQILLGALVAGIDAGRTYTDWPLMSGSFIPPFPFDLDPIWRNFFENAGLVQFMHRMAGYALLIFGLILWRTSRRSPNSGTRGAFTVVLAMMTLQMLLGIFTVLYGAPLEIAIIHQVGAVALWVIILRARFYVGYPAPDTLRGAAS